MLNRRIIVIKKGQREGEPKNSVEQQNQDQKVPEEFELACWPDYVPRYLGGFFLF